MHDQATKPITADELLHMSGLGRCELIEGEIVQMALAGAEHGDVAGEMFWWIKDFVNKHRLGKVYAAETGFVLSRNPDTVRAPDVAFVANARVPKTYREGFFDGAPDLAVEVVSPNDTHSEIASKVDQWLASGSQAVWVVDPATRSIAVYEKDGTVRRLKENDELVDATVLPGFTLRVGEVFPRR